MVANITEAQTGRVQQIIRQVVDPQRELFELGLPVTSARMAAVNEKIGWELAEKMQAAGLVGSDEKRCRQRHAAFDAAHQI